MQRLLTAAVTVPLILAAVFLLPSFWFFAFLALAVDWAAVEYIAVVRARAPHAPLRPLLVLIPLAGAALAFCFGAGVSPLPLPLTLLAASAFFPLVFGTLVLLARVPQEE
jgi:CDP-diglyceride synthetase